MTLPDVQVSITERRPSRFAPPSTGNWFAAGYTDRGPIDEAKLITSLAQSVEVFGPRVTYGNIYDSLEAFFREGGQNAYVSRIVGPAPVVSTG